MRGRLVVGVSLQPTDASKTAKNGCKWRNLAQEDKAPSGVANCQVRRSLEAHCSPGRRAAQRPLPLATAGIARRRLAGRRQDFLLGLLHRGKGAYNTVHGLVSCNVTPPHLGLAHRAGWFVANALMDAVTASGQAGGVGKGWSGGKVGLYGVPRVYRGGNSLCSAVTEGTTAARAAHRQK